MTITDTAKGVSKRLSSFIDSARYTLLMGVEREPSPDEQDPFFGDPPPDFYLVDRRDGRIYVTTEYASERSGLSQERLRQVAREGRISSVKPGGNMMFVSHSDVKEYLDNGRKKPGRPRKNHN